MSNLNFQQNHSHEKRQQEQRALPYQPTFGRSLRKSNTTSFMVFFFKVNNLVVARMTTYLRLTTKYWQKWWPLISQKIKLHIGLSSSTHSNAFSTTPSQISKEPFMFVKHLLHRVLATCISSALLAPKVARGTVVSFWWLKLVVIREVWTCFFCSLSCLVNFLLGRVSYRLVNMI